MHSATAASLYTINTSFIYQNAIQRKQPSIHFGTPARKSNGSSFACKSTRNSVYSSSVTDFDLYELLGIDSSCNQSQIKLAYRALQKKCHPDIAGPAGHDMAIILNEAYAVLSDPNSRVAYDKEQAKFSDFRGYTGKPIYSVWLGSESEKRAIFVDEVKCVGCLKCALFAEKTFAVEAVYGRARVVAQWADPEDKIEAAIETCPVDCISTVKRSDLAALEFLMSKKPREKVRIGFGNTVGARTSSIFDDLEQFQARYPMSKASSMKSKLSGMQWEAKASAIQAIRAITNWLYWETPAGQNFQNLTASNKKFAEPSIEKIRNAAEARKQARETMQHFQGVPSNYLSEGEYWYPSKHVLAEPSRIKSGSEGASIEPASTKKERLFEEDLADSKQEYENELFFWGVPVVFGTVAAVVVRLKLGEGKSGGLEEHIGGSLIRDVVNSNWLQVILAGVTWYLIGMAIVELVEVVRRKSERSRK